MAEPTKTPAQIEAEKKAAEDKRKADEQKRQQEQNQQNQGKQASCNIGGGTIGGAMTTYDHNTGQLLSVPVEEYAFEHDAISNLAGEVGRGELGHIHLDEKGTPQGAAFKKIPKPDEVYADVYGNPAVVFDDIVTPSGAPVTKHMNPAVALWDTGMLARNPPPEGGRPGDRPRGPIGGGVVNQPVAR
jgi:hypothetical protein